MSDDLTARLRRLSGALTGSPTYQEITEAGYAMSAAAKALAASGGADQEDAALDLSAMQAAVAAFAAHAWPNLTVEVESLALAEEVGELARCVVKRHHGNRGTAEDWTAELRREAGDVLLVLCNLACIEGFDLAEVGRERLAVILARDIDHDPVGAPSTDPAPEPGLVVCGNTPWPHEPNMNGIPCLNPKPAPPAPEDGGA